MIHIRHFTFLTLILITSVFSFNVQLFASPATLQESYTDVIENIHLSSSKNTVNLSWNIKYDVFNELNGEDFSIAVLYSVIGSKKTPDTIKGIDIAHTQYTIANLEEDREYDIQIGLSNGDEHYWSASQTSKTKKDWGIFEFFVLLGSLALFLYGMMTMSDGLQQATGKKLRNILSSITSNPFKGILTGLGITTLIQSSSVTAVMTVSFVNAGILTLMQAAGVIMGANIGTTVTAWIIDIFGFKVDIGAYTLVLLAVGLPMMFMSSSKVKNWANVIVGFSLLFLGLGFLKNAVPEVGPDSPIVGFFVSLNNLPYISTLVCVLFGAVLTLIIQSSSATVALTMTLMASGVIPFEVGAAMVLGENIGTTITAEMAASVGNVYAKRAARIHSSFNIFGVAWILLIFPFFLKAVLYVTSLISGGGNPITEPELYGSTGLAVLHTMFNIANTFAMVWL